MLHDMLEQAFASTPAIVRDLPGGTEVRVLEAREARTAPWPAVLAPALVEALAARGIEQPYVHQARAIEGALAGRHQVVVTPTASGKTLCYNAPVVDAVLGDGAARALYLFPTKALAQDQLHELHELVEAIGVDLKTFTYDGDTSPAARRAVRTAGHVVLTNPDMLHAGILPHHTKWVRLFENLRYVVIDELHSYRGVFGSHVAHVLRRLQRICRFYGSDPVFICTSATIANPRELAEALTGCEFDLVDENGAPQGERVVALHNPPIVNRELGLRRGVVHATRMLAERLHETGAQSIVFAGSRHQVEVLTQYLRERLPRTPGADRTVRGYRAGYLPKERREIEAGLRSGDVRTVVATTALELGIDIGGLDAAVLAGYPGTLASFWQQIGRAGRRGRTSLGVLVAGSGPLDQYVVGHPEYVFETPVEAALVNPDNPIVAAEHLKCAVFELPLDDGEASILGERTPSLLAILQDDGTVFRQGERVYWSSQAYPAQEVSLRSASEQNVIIVEQGPPARVIGQVDRPSAMTLVHDEAIYVHDGRQYHVDYLDWDELKAYVRPVDVDYYTDAQLAVDLRVLDEWDRAEDGPPAAHGEVAVTYLATIFKKIKLWTHENVGWGKIRLPQDDMHTGAFWLTLPDGLYGTRQEAEGGLHGLGQVMVQIAPLLLMCDPRDLQLSVQVRSPHTSLPTVFLWESVPGGVGFGQYLFQQAAQLIEMASAVVEECACIDGCPGCVGPPAAPGLGVKRQAGIAIEWLRETASTPAAAAAE